MDKGKNEMEKKRYRFLYEKLHSGNSLTLDELRELEKFIEPDSVAGIVDSKEKVAAALKVSLRMVYYWTKDGMPVTAKGNYDLLDIKAWRMTRRSHKDLCETQKDKWDTAYRRNKALLLGVEYKKVLGELLVNGESKPE